jgi:[acyl-carrier-protein] S-malonyltransferase
VVSEETKKVASVAFLFPGQGSQYVGMGKDICDNIAAARLVFEEAEDELHINIRKLAFEGPEEELSKTENTQPALLAASMAVLAAMREAGIGGKNPPIFFAGHSLGEYSALTAAGSLTLREAARLVRKRGHLMQEAVGEGVGAMAAVLGMDAEKLDALVKEVSTPREIVVAANYNGPGQIVVSGHRTAIERLEKSALEAGALKVIVLKVSVPSHSPLMEGAARSLNDELSAVSFAEPGVPVISNVTAVPYPNKDAMVDLLTRQLVSPVRWEESVRHMIEHGTGDFVEVGPGRVLSGLVKRIDKRIAAVSVGDIASLKEAEKKYQ